MWIVIKFDKKNFTLLKTDLKKKAGIDCKFYIPKLMFKIYRNKCFVKKEINLLGDYIFCFNKKFENSSTIKNINYSRGLKYILNGFNNSQNEICEFIEKCRSSEDSQGYISEQFYDLTINYEYKFFSGPFTNSIFKIIQLQKNKIKILMGNVKTTISKKNFLFQPI